MTIENIEVIKALITASGAVLGAIIGAIVAISAIWIKEKFDDRKNSQTWFEQTYIFDGIDKVLAYLRFRDIQLVKLLSIRQMIEIRGKPLAEGLDTLPQNEELEVIPVEALVKIETLLNDFVFTGLISTISDSSNNIRSISPEKRSQVNLIETIQLIRQGYESLKEIRRALLNIKVKTKHDIHSLYKNNAIEVALKKFNEQSDSWDARTGERDRLIAKGL